MRNYHSKYSDSPFYHHFKRLINRINEIDKRYNKRSKDAEKLIGLMSKLNHLIDKVMPLFENGNKPKATQLLKLRDPANVIDELDRSLRNFTIEDKDYYEIICEIIYFLMCLNSHSTISELLPFLNPQAIVLDVGLFYTKFQEGTEPDDFKYLYISRNVIGKNTEFEYSFNELLKTTEADFIGILTSKAKWYIRNHLIQAQTEKERANKYISLKEVEIARHNARLNPYAKILDEDDDISNDMDKIKDKLQRIDILLQDECDDVNKPYDQLPEFVIQYDESTNMLNLIKIKSALLESAGHFLVTLRGYKTELVKRKIIVQQQLDKAELDKLVAEHTSKINDLKKEIEIVVASYEELRGQLEVFLRDSNIDPIEYKIKQSQQTLIKMKQTLQQVEMHIRKASISMEAPEALRQLYSGHVQIWAKIVDTIRLEIIKYEAHKDKLGTQNGNSKILLAVQSSRVEGLPHELENAKSRIVETSQKLKECKDLIDISGLQVEVISREAEALLSVQKQYEEALQEYQTRNNVNYRSINTLISSINEQLSKEVEVTANGNPPDNYEDLVKQIEVTHKKKQQHDAPIMTIDYEKHIRLLGRISTLIEKNSKRIPFKIMDQIYFDEFGKEMGLKKPKRNDYLKLFAALKIELDGYSDWVDYRARRKSLIGKATVEEFDIRKKRLSSVISSRAVFLKRIKNDSLNITASLETIKAIESNIKYNNDEISWHTNLLDKTKDTLSKTNIKHTQLRDIMDSEKSKYDHYMEEQSRLEEYNFRLNQIATKQLRLIEKEIETQIENKSNEFKENVKSHAFKNNYDAFLVESMLRWHEEISISLKSLSVLSTDEIFKEDIKKTQLQLDKFKEELGKIREDIKRHHKRIEERRCLVRVFQEENLSYLIARHKEHWILDALHLSDRKKREEYVADLNEALETYIQTGDEAPVNVIIANGIKKFKGQIFGPMVLQGLKNAINDFQNETLNDFQETGECQQPGLTTGEKARLIKIFDMQYKQYCDNKSLIKRDRFFPSDNGKDNELAKEIKQALQAGNKADIHAKIVEGKGKFGNLVLVPILLHPLEMAMNDLLQERMTIRH